MTKKDYVMLADTIAELRKTLPETEWKVVASTLLLRLELHNPRFNRQRFLKAVGLEHW